MDPDASAPARPFRLGAVLVGALIFSLLAIEVWHSHTPSPWERPIITAVARFPLPGGTFWTALFEPIPFALLTFALACAAAARGRISLAIAGLTGCLTAVVAAELVFKPMIDRYRIHLVGINRHVEHFGGPMFPSSHVTAAAAWATFAWLVLDQRSRLRPFLVALPFIMGWAVISRHMHYPADVVGGLILGPTAVYCTVSLLRTAARWEAQSNLDSAPPDRVDATA